MYEKPFDVETLEVLSEITEGAAIPKLFMSEDNRELNEALHCKYPLVDQVPHLVYCAKVLVEEREANRKEIQQLKDETLKKVVDDQEKIISTYNGTYLQRTKVKNGKKIARKDTVTKEAIQQLKSQHLTINQISKKLGCSRSTVWRRLNEQTD